MKENGPPNNLVSDIALDQQNKYMKLTGSGNQINTANSMLVNYQNI